MTGFHWRYEASSGLCGSCRHPIAKGALRLEISTTERRLTRCQPCGEKMAGPPPDEIEPLALPVPLHRGADFVSPKKLAQSVRFNDFMARKGGQ